MDEYEVIITPDAESELNELDDYITFELLSPNIEFRGVLENGD